MAQKKTETSEVEELKAKIAEMEAAAKATPPGRPQFSVKGARDPKEGRKAVLAAHSNKPKTYRALENGTDFKQGFIPRGTIFSTTQPQGSWMEEVTAKQAEAEEAE